jgi:ABC-type multidrug transport system fused ATPase/permease subunit
LLALLQRLYDVEEGSIYIDGHEIRFVTQASLRENIAMVNQDIFLFHDTIANNIATADSMRRRRKSSSRAAGACARLHRG